jgi:hypothetical protein
MKILLFILGLVIAVLGLGLTISSWYVADSEGRIVDGLAYAGPLLLIIGLWRVLSSATAATPPAIFRIIAVGIGFAAGFGNTAALKAVFPGDQIISTNSTH